ncbi:MAG: MFS transporter [Bacteroidetes bacterium]|nr:MFS transporter [Bacteroidota bacterium]MCL5026543.1 MFS transporter [Chloroflexota bacterium]
MKLSIWAKTSTTATVEEDWARNLFVLLVAIFVEETGWSLTSPFLPIFITELGVPDLKEAALWAGVALAASTVINSPMTPFWGAMADRFGRKLILIRAFVALAVSNAGAGLVTSVPQLVGVRLASAFFTGAIPLSYAIITSGAPRSKTAQSVAYLQTTAIAAGAVGPLIGGVIVDRMGVRPSFFFASAMCLVSLYLIIFVFRDPRREEALPLKAQETGVGRTLMALLPFVGLLFLVQMIDRTFQPIIPVYVSELEGTAGMTGFWSGLTFSMAAAGMALSANAMARLSRNHSPLKLLIGCLGAGAVLCLPLITLRSVWQLAIARALLTAFVGGANTLVFALGSAMGLGRGSVGKSAVLVMGQQMGGSLGPLAGGALVQWNLRGMFLVDSALYLAALLLSATAVRTRLRRAKS